MGLGELRAPSYLDRNHLETPTNLVHPSHPLLRQLFLYFFHPRTNSGLSEDNHHHKSIAKQLQMQPEHFWKIDQFIFNGMKRKK